eukprot:CAMPEP_0181211826 /NCGR_PEP_ID=MMETSP1096-20121128/24008_1 /TAXON_ID=156174 ORGANISM="Chrysochromulina ericina, Strain CCMP281" /NCGR_SAMPLE_ID=MMETSP1096 /ASSEMBLY_ACC=CAM_ASM_000453 /LENGTH=146 /DNA_ID=CAMNT_0023303283 /DNA_START=317 /DNA_END=757 /DNA_ORIENTATION=+
MCSTGAWRVSLPSSHSEVPGWPLAEDAAALNDCMRLTIMPTRSAPVDAWALSAKSQPLSRTKYRAFPSAVSRALVRFWEHFAVAWTGGLAAHADAGEHQRWQKLQEKRRYHRYVNRGPVRPDAVRPSSASLALQELQSAGVLSSFA